MWPKRLFSLLQDDHDGRWSGLQVSTGKSCIILCSHCSLSRCAFFRCEKCMYDTIQRAQPLNFLLLAPSGYRTVVCPCATFTIQCHKLVLLTSRTVQ